MENKNKKIGNTGAFVKDSTPSILLLSLPLAALLIITSCKGIFATDFYKQETFNWQTQSIGQDLVNLALITPLLIITAVYASVKKKMAVQLWAGVNLYLLYTFIIYCFSVHFNEMFFAYCIILGLSFYSFLYFLFNNEASETKKMSTQRAIGFYFILVSVTFYYLWLKEVLQATGAGSTPKNLKETGLFTNPVHVLDLSVVLPGIFVCGLLLLKRKRIALLFTPILLMFFVLMDITIAFLTFFMNEKGIASDLIISAVMLALAVVTIIFLFLFIKRNDNEKDHSRL